MAYRLTRKAAARRKWRPRADAPLEDQREPAWQPPELRRRVIVEDYDGCDTQRHVIELYRTPRIDCYRAVVDGKPWRERAGWTQVLDGLRRAMPRVASESKRA